MTGPTDDERLHILHGAIRAATQALARAAAATRDQYTLAPPPVAATERSQQK